MKRRHDNRGISLIELIIVIAIMGVLVGVISPMFVKYVARSRKARDIYTADEIARAVNVAFIENHEAYNKFQKWENPFIIIMNIMIIMNNLKEK